MNKWLQDEDGRGRGSLWIVISNQASIKQFVNYVCLFQGWDRGVIEVPGLIPAVPALCLRNLLRIINLFMMTTTTITIKGLLGYPQLHSAKKFGRT